MQPTVYPMQHSNTIAYSNCCLAAAVQHHSAHCSAVANTYITMKSAPVSSTALQLIEL